MGILFLVIPVALAFVLAAIAAWGWAARSGQFDDLDTPPRRILHDED